MSFGIFYVALGLLAVASAILALAVARQDTDRKTKGNR